MVTAMMLLLLPVRWERHGIHAWMLQPNNKKKKELSTTRARGGPARTWSCASNIVLEALRAEFCFHYNSSALVKVKHREHLYRNGWLTLNFHIFGTAVALNREAL